MGTPSPEELARAACEAASAKRAIDIVALHVGEAADICDYFVICSGQTARQVDAIAEAVDERVKGDYGLDPIGVEGADADRWVLMDYGSVIVHVFLPEVRDYYRLERLWGDVGRLEWRDGDDSADGDSADDGSADDDSAFVGRDEDGNRDL